MESGPRRSSAVELASAESPSVSSPSRVSLSLPLAALVVFASDRIDLSPPSFAARTTERVVPADPANPTGFEQKIMEAGQVWTPNSAYKTAQAIMDIDREGLPLIILANMRGFSGGQQDMVRRRPPASLARLPPSGPSS